MEFIFEGITQGLKAIVTGDPDVMGATWRSVWISTLAVTLAGLLGIPLGVGLARRRFVGSRLLIEFIRTTMALPTVFIGLVCYSVFARSGPLGALDLLYTPWVILIGEFLLAFPIVVSLTQGAVASLDPRVGETLQTLSLSRWTRFKTYVSEAHVGVKLALLTAFSRCVTELGIAMMVGGNLKGHTRTLSTATAMETSKGEFGNGMAMGFILLFVALAVTFLMSRLTAEDPK